MCMVWCNASNLVRLLNKDRRPKGLVSNMTYEDMGSGVSLEWKDFPISASSFCFRVTEVYLSFGIPGSAYGLSISRSASEWPCLNNNEQKHVQA